MTHNHYENTFQLKKYQTLAGNQYIYCLSGDIVPEHDLIQTIVLLIMHNQRETNQILSSKQESLFQYGYNFCIYKNMQTFPNLQYYLQAKESGELFISLLCLCCPHHLC